MSEGPRNIVFVGGLPPNFGGAHHMNAFLLQGLSAMGHNIEGLVPSTSVTAPTLEADWRGSTIRVTWFPVANFSADPLDPTGGRNPDLLQRPIADNLERLLSTAAPEVILCDENSASGVAGVASRHGIPFVVVAHGLFTEVLQGRFPPHLQGLLVPALRQADMIVGVARYMAAGLKQSGFDQAIAIPNRVDTGTFRPGPRQRALRRRLGFGADDLVVLHASSLQPVKRPMDLFASAVDATREIPRLRYLTVGDGFYPNDLAVAVRNAGLGDRFRVLAEVPHASMPAYYQLADIVVMMSDREGLPLVFLEAMASGCVLISSDIPAAREAIRDGETGVVFPVGDVDALTKTTLRLAADPDLRSRIGRRARDHAVATYDAKHWVRDYAAAIESVISR